MGSCKRRGGYTMHSYWLLLYCGLLALAGADKFKLCLSSDPAVNQCLGVEQGLVTLKSADDSSTNWGVFESAGPGGVYFHNLESCTVATIEGGTLQMRQKTDSSSHGWLLHMHLCITGIHLTSGFTTRHLQMTNIHLIL